MAPRLFVCVHCRTPEAKGGLAKRQLVLLLLVLNAGPGQTNAASSQLALRSSALSPTSLFFWIPLSSSLSLFTWIIDVVQCFESSCPNPIQIQCMRHFIEWASLSVQHCQKAHSEKFYWLPVLWIGTVFVAWGLQNHSPRNSIPIQIQCAQWVARVGLFDRSVTVNGCQTIGFGIATITKYIEKNAMKLPVAISSQIQVTNSRRKCCSECS